MATRTRPTLSAVQQHSPAWQSCKTLTSTPTSAHPPCLAAAASILLRLLVAAIPAAMPAAAAVLSLVGSCCCSGMSHWSRSLVICLVWLGPWCWGQLWQLSWRQQQGEVWVRGGMEVLLLSMLCRG